jgi:glycolate oxidase iron-sulfur subunit
MQRLGEPRLLRFVATRLLPNPKKMDLYVRLAALGKKGRLDRAARALGVLKWFGRDRDKVVDLVEGLPLRFFRERAGELGPSPDMAKRQVAYFVGCATNYALPQVGISTIRTLRAVGCNVKILDNVCCGLPLASYGDEKGAKELALRNLDMISRLDVDAIVTDCGSCSSFLKEYPLMFADDPKYADAVARTGAKIKALSEYLMEIGLPGFERRVEARVTYHDPCHMSRYQNLIDEPREIIRRIPGIDYRELPEADWCCGAAGTYSIAHYGQSMEILDRKMKNVKSTEADIIVTTCPACYIQLAYGVKRHGLDCEVLDLADLIDRALKPPKP